MPDTDKKPAVRRGLPYFFLVLAWVGLAWGVAGCARFQSQPLSAADNVVQLDSRSLCDPGLKTFLDENLPHRLTDWPASSWDFDMLTLAALYYQPALAVGRAQLLVAEGGGLTAAQRPNPTFNVTPTYNFTTLTPSPWLPLGSLDVPLETAGKRRYRREEAAHRAQAARLAVLTTAWRTRSELRAALVDFCAAEARNPLLRHQIDIREQLLKKVEQQVQAGALAGSEALNLRVTLAKARLDYSDNERQQIELRSRVAAAIGVPLAALRDVRLVYEVRTEDTLVAQLSSAEVRRLTLTSRPDILGALAEYAASESALQLEIAKQYPDLRLAPGYEYDQGDSKWSLALTVDLPLLNQNQGPIAQAKARRAESAARFNQLQASVLTDLDRAIEVLRIAGKNSSLLRGIAEEQQRKRNSVAAQVNAGAIDAVELLNAEIELAATELAQFEGELRARQAFGSLQDVVQRPFEMPAAVLNQGAPYAF